MSIKALQTQLEQIERATASRRMYEPSQQATSYSGVSLRQGLLHSPTYGHPLLASPRPSAQSLMRSGGGAASRSPALRPLSISASDLALPSLTSAAMRQMERAAAMQLQRTLEQRLEACPETWEAQLRVYESVRALASKILRSKLVANTLCKSQADPIFG